jgi:hypothetical protein
MVKKYNKQLKKYLLYFCIFIFILIIFFSIWRTWKNIEQLANIPTPSMGVTIKSNTPGGISNPNPNGNFIGVINNYTNFTKDLSSGYIDLSLNSTTPTILPYQVSNDNSTIVLTIKPSKPPPAPPTPSTPPMLSTTSSKITGNTITGNVVVPKTYIEDNSKKFNADVFPQKFTIDIYIKPTSRNEIYNVSDSSPIIKIIPDNNKNLTISHLGVVFADSMSPDSYGYFKIDYLDPYHFTLTITEQLNLNSINIVFNYNYP